MPIYLLNAVGAHGVALALGKSSPGLGSMLLATLAAATVTVAIVMLIAYYSSLAAYRLGLDPDTYGIPIVTSSVDFLGALALVVAITLLVA